jgi:cytochrome c oxidase cbb3-type subunit 3
MRKAYNIVAALFAAMCLAAQERPRHSTPERETINPLAAENAKRGQQQFLKSCAFCHGTDANGGAEGPSLVRSALVRHDDNGNLIGQVIREGRPDKGMPRIPLTSGQIADVVAFLHAKVTVSDRTSPSRPSSQYALKLLLTGDAAAGRRYFYGAGGCSGCHSPAGDLAGISKKYAPADLQTRFLYPAGEPRRATVTLPSGQQVEGELLHESAFNIAIRDSAGWYRSWPADQVKMEIHDPLAAHRRLLRKYTEHDMHNLFAYLETLK